MKPESDTLTVPGVVSKSINRPSVETVKKQSYQELPEMEVEDENDEAAVVNDDPVEEDESLFELEIKNLDTNEVFKLHIPICSEKIEH